MATVITKDAITWTLTGTVTNGTFVTGDPYVVDSGSGVILESRTPAPTGSGSSARNGGMINPKHEATALNGFGTRHIYYHGYDGRVSSGLTYTGGTYANLAVYRDGDNAELSYPVTLNAGDSLCSSGSNNPSGAVPANAEAMADMSVLTVLGSDPGSGLAFRPPYYGTTKPLWLKSQVDYDKLPRLTPPIASPTTGSNPFFATDSSSTAVQKTFERLQYNIHSYSNIGVRTMRPVNNMESYPRDQAGLQCQMIAYMLCDFSGAEETYANRLIQMGIDNYAIVTDFPDGLYAGAGFGFGFLFPILFAGWMLDDADMQGAGALQTSLTDYYGDPIPSFQEVAQTVYSTNALIDYRLPRPRSSYPSGPPLYGDVRLTELPPSNHSDRDPAGKYDGGKYDVYEYPYPWSDETNTWNNNGTLYNVKGSAKMVMPVLASHVMGFSNLWQCPSLLDYVDRWGNDLGMYEFFNINSNNTYNAISTFRRDIGGFSGSGNGFCHLMWQYYRYPGGNATTDGRKLIAF
jgi:hypothetical protein